MAKSALCRAKKLRSTQLARRYSEVEVENAEN